MPTIRDVAMRALGLVRRGSMERRLDAEMRFHVEMLTEQHIRAGRSPSDARRAALAAFGGLERFKDDARDEYRSRLVDELGQDIRYAVRVIRRNPGFGVAAALTFALGIGASTAIFSVVHGVLLRPLPYKDPDRLVVLWERQPGRGNDRNVVSVPNFEAWRSRARSFEGMAALVPLPATIGMAPNPEHVMGAEVSPGYFETLGVSPALGRTFASSEEQNGGADVIVLSDGFWRSHFGGDDQVIGRTLALDGRPHTIVGVMPSSFDPPRFAWLNDQAFWRPFGPTDNNRGWGRFLLVVGRVKRDVPVNAALREVQGIAAQRATEDKGNEGWSANIVGLSAQITGDARLPLLVLLGAVCLLKIRRAEIAQDRVIARHVSLMQSDKRRADHNEEITRRRYAEWRGLLHLWRGSLRARCHCRGRLLVSLHTLCSCRAGKQQREGKTAHRSTRLAGREKCVADGAVNSSRPRAS